MTNEAWVMVAVLAVIAIAAIIWAMQRENRSKKLRSKFGPEYERVVRERGSPARAEKELDSRARRVERLKLRTLTRDECERFASQWMAVQQRFVDDPRSAIAEADDLIGRSMQIRGYPMADFELRAADISVDHPHVVQHYRAAHEIAIRDARSEASTEDLRVAMKHYRVLLEDLLGRRVTEFQQEVRR